MVLVTMYCHYHAVKSSAEPTEGEGLTMAAPIKQLSIVAPSKKRVHGKLQKHIRVSEASCDCKAV